MLNSYFKRKISISEKKFRSNLIKVIYIAISILLFTNDNLFASTLTHATRIKNYQKISKYLSSLNNKEILKIIKSADSINEKNYIFKTKIKNTPVFIKKIPLTELEYKTENHYLTDNLFKLPMYYQYGIGSEGFNGWRELMSNILTTKWVISGECTNFIIMYHWRLIPNNTIPSITFKQQQEIDNHSKIWGKSRSIRTRYKALLQAPANIILFLEYIPKNTETWLKQQLEIGNDTALEMIEKELLSTISFMQSHGMIHFDSHFKNILTDGNHLYFTDFGLTLLSTFALSSVEREFFINHHNYDLSIAMTNFVYSLITSLHGEKGIDVKLKEYQDNKIKINSKAQVIINKYIQKAILMTKFYNDLLKNKLATFPSQHVKKSISMNQNTN